MNARHVMGILAIALVAACTPKEEKANTDASATATATATTTATANTPPATAENDPLPSHKEAAKTVYPEITKTNYTSVLEKMEKEP